MIWVCPRTHRPLDRRDADGIGPDAGGATYALEGGCPVFAADAQTVQRVRRPVPVLDALLERMERTSVDEAARGFCREHGCSREPYAADWKYLFAPAERGVVLEIGAGFGDDSTMLAAPERAALLVPTVVNAKILQHRLGAGDWAIAVCDEAERLPLADGSVAGLAVEQAAFAGFGIDALRIDAVAAEWRRMAAPGAAVFVGVSSPLFRVPGARTLAAKIQRPRAEPMNRAVKRASNRPAGGLSPGRVTDALRRAGFEGPELFAPLPSENKIDVVIPVDDRTVVRYFLDNLVRKNSPVVRAVLHAARAANGLGLMRHLVPYRYLIFRAPGSAT